MSQKSTESKLIDERTENLNLPLPHSKNKLEQDIVRIRESFTGMDAAHAKLEEALKDNTSLHDKSLAEEGKARQEADQSLTERIAEEEEARATQGAELEKALSAQDKTQAEALAAQAQGQTQALSDHNDALDCHDALVKRITVGSLSPVIGIVNVQEGGGSGLWFNCDEHGQPVSPPRSYFDYHPTYNALRKVLVDNQIMIEHKKFYYKTMTITEGPFTGKQARIISPDSKEGYKVFPSFMKEGQEIDEWYCGAYSAVDEGGTPKKLGSRPGKMPFVNVNFPTMQGYCENRNTAGVSGFQMIDVYQLSELQLLALVEAGTTDTQAVYGRGRVDTSSANMVDATDVATATWRGHVGLWGNVWQMVQGFRLGAGGRVEIWDNQGNRTWCNTGHIQPTGAPTYCKKLKSGKGEGYDFDEVFFMETAAGAADATFPDYYYNNNAAGNVLYFGGDWSYGSGAGLFCLNCNGAASYVYVSLGCRLAKS